jgi:hypothetical protein
MLMGRHRALLAMATGTGKTWIAFNIAWNLRQTGYAKRVLFLADRINLRDQAYKEFSGFADARRVVEFHPGTAGQKIATHSGSSSSGSSPRNAAQPRAWSSLEPPHDEDVNSEHVHLRLWGLEVLVRSAGPAWGPVYLSDQILTSHKRSS